MGEKHHFAFVNHVLCFIFQIKVTKRELRHILLPEGVVSVKVLNTYSTDIIS